MTRAREQFIDLEQTPYYHCMARCVRRAFLFGEDKVTGKRFDHRKAWVVDKLAFLAEVFAIDACAYAVMSNHYHVVLHVDSERADRWSEKEVLERWTSLFAGNLLISRFLNGDEQSRAELAKVSELVEERRARLMDISWFMRVLNESIARMANEEDGVKGRFWEGRFKSQALLDEAAVLACMTYVDLNPIRAGIAELPENSDFTSIQDRIHGLANRKVGRPRKAKPTAHQSNFDKKPDLAPFKRGDKAENVNKVIDLDQHREGIKPIDFTLKDYLELIDWMGRAIRADKKGSIPEGAPKILDRLGIPPDKWMQFAPNIETTFTHAVGDKQALQKFANCFDRAWSRGQQMGGKWY